MSSLIGRFLKYTFPYRRSIMRRFASKYFDEQMGYATRHLELINKVPRGFIKYIALRGLHPSIGLEIGVAQGHNSESIFKMLDPKTMYLIDPYTSYSELGSLFNDSQKDLSLMFDKLEPYLDRIVFFRQTSDRAYILIPPILDFVYIDGCHEYEYVYNDLKNYFDRVKKGGIVAGHDIQIPQVLEAVQVFCKIKKLSFITLDVDFIIQK